MKSIRLYVAAVAAACLLLITFQFQRGEPFRFVEFTFFLALFFVSQAKPILLPRVSLTVSFMVAVVAIIKMAPEGVTLAASLGALGLLAGDERPEWYKLLFNGAQLGLAGGLAAETYHRLGGTPDIKPETLPAVIIATGAATLVFFFVNTLAVSGAISISTKSPFLPTWAGNFGWMAATYAAFGGSGIVLASLLQVVGYLALPLLLVPLLVARNVFRSYQQVSQAYDSTIKAFVSAIEAKDAYTRGHSERVTEYAMLIARRVGMADDQLTAFRYGALLHDVGKLAIRKKILTKPGRLEDFEYEEIKKHPVLGAQIVQEIEFLRPALDGVLYHHERLDGSGYPAGLAGDVVPEWARIMAVADTYDAMTSTRAYRAARSHQEAIDELKRFSGTQFDPKFVDMFIDALEEERRAGTVPSGYVGEALPNPAG